MPKDDFEALIKRLITGLADQEIKAGKSFKYDSAPLLAEDVADITAPTVLCMAQDLAERVGMTGFGLNFKLGEANPVFPIHYSVKDSAKEPQFLDAAPWVTEIFDGELMECRHDLAHFFEVGAKLLRPDFNLEINTNYRAGVDSVVDVNNASPSITPDMDR